ncbi:MAG: 4Fe-4S dicluster domain-containing protein [Desulfitobacterium hafniense]|nr:4Fe-4S dicluster domain-containing protein [Desulfitobacterium hafniense]
MKTLRKCQLDKALDTISQNAVVYAPVKKGEMSCFVRYQDGVELELEENTLFSPKGILFPAAEKMYSYETTGLDMEIKKSDREFGLSVLFGVRSCDVQAIVCLDDVFLSKGFADEYYLTRRQETTIVALGCTNPGVNCFCQSMGLNPLEHEMADVQLFDLGDIYGLRARTEKGEILVKALDEVGLLAAGEGVSNPEVGEFFYNFSPEGVVEKLQMMFESPLWNELAQKCLNCGVCTFLCPTCHCFDISGKKQTAHCGHKLRCWDSCMFSEYTLMAGGHNPRPTKMERVRQRFMHKLRYFPERYGKFLCTGCGRCMAKCPVNLEITQVIRQVKEAVI